MQLILEILQYILRPDGEIVNSSPLDKMAAI